jgi:hypothetical protein
LECFGLFVTSWSAPSASGWDEHRQSGFPPEDSTCLRKAHSTSPRIQSVSPCGTMVNSCHYTTYDAGRSGAEAAPKARRTALWRACCTLRGLGWPRSIREEAPRALSSETNRANASSDLHPLADMITGCPTIRHVARGAHQMPKDGTNAALMRNVP